MKNKPICTLLWRDASYSYFTEAPLDIPLPQLTTGFIIQTNDEFTVIATNVEYNKNTGEIAPLDGFIIPDKAIIEFKKITNYHDK